MWYSELRRLLLVTNVSDQRSQDAFSAPYFKSQAV